MEKSCSKPTSQKDFSITFIFAFLKNVLYMEEKKKIGFLTLLIAIAGIIVAVIDAVVAVSYAVVPLEPSSTDFFDLVINGPVWWKINPIIVMTIISVGIVAFLLGSDLRFSANPIKSFFGFMRVVLTFVITSLSGLGDIISQTFIEFLMGRNVLGWLYYDWWWTKYMPLPAVIAFFVGHSVPSGIDMAVASVLGIVLLIAMWLHYYEKISFAKIRAKVLGQ